MGATRRRILRTTGVLAVSAVLAASCASQRMLVSPAAPASPDSEKLKVHLKVEHKYVDPITDLKIGGAAPDKTFNTCPKAEADMNKCRLGYPVKADGTEYFGALTREPVLILTDVVNPGSSCVCYGSKCYCR